jgi:Bifunctional DNA primase/polymerase, N-terminal
MTTPLEIALDAIARGWNPVPIEYRTKKPIGAEWQLRVIDAGNAARYFNGAEMNIGVLLGPTSHNLTDVDHDADEAICIGPYVLPRTKARFGRASKRDSHSLYYTGLSGAGLGAALAFDDPKKPKRQGRLIELRIGGASAAQTVLPGSVHQTGEAITWEADGEPATVDGDDLLRQVKMVAAYSLLARYWPAEGSGHHDTARVVGGLLARTGLGPETVRIHVEAIAKAANSSRWRELCRTAEDAAKAFAGGKHAFGFQGLCEAFDDVIARRVADWLDHRGSDTAPPQPNTTTSTTETDGISLGDFRAYMPQHCYVYLRSREPWPASSINGRFPPVPLVDAAGNPVLNAKGKQQEICASQWLDQNLPVEQMTWAPGEPTLIADRLVSHGGWIRQRGVTCLNLYMPPIVVLGDAAQATIWIEHVYRVFPNDGEHIILWLAHRVQRPAEKINHALVLGGLQGIGKDSMLEPLKGAVGPWNFLEVSPSQMLGRFNGFLKAVILRGARSRRC